MSEPEILRVQDMEPPPGMEPWQWGTILSEMGDLVLAKPTEHPVVVVKHCPDCGFPHPVLARAILPVREAIKALQERINSLVNQGGTVGDTPWEQDADAWKK